MRQNVQVAGVVLFYIFAALMMVTVNKWVLVSAPIPIFFLFGQLVIAVILLYISHLFGLVTLPTTRFSLGSASTGGDKFPYFLVLINVIGLSLNTFCLQLVDASFYQVARGLVLPITVGLALVFEAKSPSRAALGACAVITVGFLTGALLDGGNTLVKDASALGILFGLLSSLSTAVHSLIIKRSLAAFSNSAVKLAWFNSLWSAFAVIPVMLLAGERTAIMEVFADEEKLYPFITGTLITGLFGFLICIAGFLSIKVTSPVTHMVSSSARGILQTVIGATVFGDALTRTRLSSIFIVTLGSCFYVWAKHQEGVAAARDAPPRGKEDIEASREKGVLLENGIGEKEKA